MPELPEVETVRRHLAGVVEKRRLIDVQLRHPRLGRRHPDPAMVESRLLDQVVETVGRRGKFILARLRSGLTWVMHLGMSGRVTIARPGDPEAPHTHFLVTTDRGDEVRLVDPRTFGFVAVMTVEELADQLHLGPDALDELPGSRQLSDRLANRKAPIKSMLLDQRLIAGLGNIYADEVLYRARVRPTRPAGEVEPAELVKLRAAIRPLLQAGIRSGGTSLNDLAYLLPDGRAGDFRRRLAVYGREGEPCLRCGNPIERVTVGGRSSFFCPRCQV
jgi:formamidopyrimidine-DNA glycosylase